MLYRDINLISRAADMLSDPIPIFLNKICNCINQFLLIGNLSGFPKRRNAFQCKLHIPSEHAHTLRLCSFQLQIFRHNRRNQLYIPLCARNCDI